MKRDELVKETVALKTDLGKEKINREALEMTLANLGHQLEDMEALKEQLKKDLELKEEVLQEAERSRDEIAKEFQAKEKRFNEIIKEREENLVCSKKINGYNFIFNVFTTYIAVQLRSAYEI